MNASVYNATGATVGTVTLDATLFGIEPNTAVMHQALVRQQANARLGNHDTKTRGEVSGGGKKPYKQKGTGRARQGSSRSPQWKGGGTVWGPHPRMYTQAMPRKMRQLAIKSALSAKAEQVLVLQGAETIEGRTKAMVSFLHNIGNPRSALVIVPERIETLYHAAGNLSHVKVLHAGYLNMADLFKYEQLVFTVEALEKISDIWGDDAYSVTVTEGVNSGASSIVASDAMTTSDAVPTGEAVTTSDTMLSAEETMPAPLMLDEDAEMDTPVADADATAETEELA